ncbi:MULTISPECIES: HAD family hydrolase [Planktothricoides]|uniref:HAD family hydrolase n=2 Tax=Planktothricoides raciborskii TaxID=132608 RepID=A0AAU8J7X9_9CYAN|nr:MULTISPECIES: HAD family hydrolase [Planktothricoides]KOR36744.1 hypothetical protein AM228_11285 [Planktothricoides sp. SR001]MBD2545044.1 HAD family hydrolase [Planktothricoides raciborskii FACHB-1370]MBD2584818.1 HAD family hydrolase [Planktothricoides raciborskii FACHB-1261]
MKGYPAFDYQRQKWSSQQASGCKYTMTVFCDFDGPIVDVSERYYTTYQQGLKSIEAIAQSRGDRLDLFVLSQAQFWQMKRDRIPDAEIASQSGLTEPYIPLFLQQVKEIVNQPDLLEKDTLQPGVRWALALLHTRGYRLVLVTLRHQSQVKEILHNTGLAKLFTDIYGTRDRHAAYQNYAQLKTDLLAEAMAKYSQPDVSLCWMVGDTEADILAGQALKIPTIGLTCGIRSAWYLQQFHPDKIKTDLLSAVQSIIGCAELVSA